MRLGVKIRNQLEVTRSSCVILGVRVTIKDHPV